MFYRLMLVVAAMAASAGLAATSAQADSVVVENPGAYEIESEVDFAFVIHMGGMEIPQLKCDNHWDLSITADGRGTIQAEDGLHEHATPPSIGPCVSAEPCPATSGEPPPAHAPWPVTLEEENNAFRIHMSLCLVGLGGGFSGVALDVECDFDHVNNSFHCDDTVLPGREVTGEFQVHGDLGLMHQ